MLYHDRIFVQRFWWYKNYINLCCTPNQTRNKRTCDVLFLKTLCIKPTLRGLVPRQVKGLKKGILKPRVHNKSNKDMIINSVKTSIVFLGKYIVSKLIIGKSSMWNENDANYIQDHHLA